MEVEVIRSRKRKKTLSARLEGEKLKIMIPHNLSKREEREFIAKAQKDLLKKRENRELNRTTNLMKRAQYLNDKYFEGKLRIRSIKFVTNQNSRFGSCSVGRGDIRISDRVSKAPDWVLDYLLIHEMAHLIEANHSKAFWDLVYRYKWTERARGYLIALSLEEDEMDND